MCLTFCFSTKKLLWYAIISNTTYIFNRLICLSLFVPFCSFLWLKCILSYALSVSHFGSHRHTSPWEPHVQEWAWHWQLGGPVYRQSWGWPSSFSKPVGPRLALAPGPKATCLLQPLRYTLIALHCDYSFGFYFSFADGRVVRRNVAGMGVGFAHFCTWSPKASMFYYISTSWRWVSYF